MAVSYNKFQQFVGDVNEGVHAMGSDALYVCLTNTAPTATDAVFTDLTEISAGSGYTAGGQAVTVSASAQTSGTYKLTIADEVFTASGGTIGPFRYATLYNNTPTSPADPLVAYWDYGSSITLNDTETFTVDFDAVNGVYTMV